MKIRRRRWFATGCALVAIAIASLLVFLRQDEDYVGEIRAGRFVYAAKLGWINCRHANSQGVRCFLDELQARWRKAGKKPFEISYSQSMLFEAGPLKIRFVAFRTYAVAGGLSRDDLDQMAFGIFREVSEDFEEMQGRFPNALDARSQSSSFREGDLMGNLIAFYCALHRCDRDTLNAWLGPTSIAATLEQFQRAGIGKKRSWDLPCTMARSPLAELKYDRAWLVERTKSCNHGTRRKISLAL